MSIMRCNDCNCQIDTDFPERFETVEHKYGEYILCLSCAEEALAEQDRLDAMASLAEYEAERTRTTTQH